MPLFRVQGILAVDEIDMEKEVVSANIAWEEKPAKAETSGNCTGNFRSHMLELK